ncbi:DNA cytosine methyltransferase [Listeria aquatica]|uniref:DNA cytosine methyltransferase n=1 Tax=Listeria aquatica TaxID=1494960 RepID=UPI0004B54D5F|nr:DNA cytosine methyltransferase [Listeria aquatica]
MLTSIDLFSGPGGLATGFGWAGIKPLIAIEWSDHTVQTYSKSHGAEILVLEDFLLRERETNFTFDKSDKTLLIHGDIRKVSNELIKKNP